MYHTIISPFGNKLLMHLLWNSNKKCIECKILLLITSLTWYIPLTEIRFLLFKNKSNSYFLYFYSFPYVYHFFVILSQTVRIYNALKFMSVFNWRIIIQAILLRAQIVFFDTYTGCELNKRNEWQNEKRKIVER